MAQPTEFDVAGATYYAVAPAGYSYSAEQDTQYDTRKYNTLSAAEAALPSTLTTPCVINIIGDWTGVTDTTEVSLGFLGGNPTTTAANYLLVRAVGEARHEGVWDTSKYRLICANTTYCIQIQTDYVRIDGLLIGRSSSNVHDQQIIDGVTTTGGDSRLSNCILKGSNHGTYRESAIASFRTIKVWNCIVYGINLSSFSSGTVYLNNASATMDLYSCTFIGGSQFNVRNIAGTINAKNCYAYSPSQPAYQGTITKTTCASSDTSGNTGLQNIAYDTNTFVNVTAGSEDHNLPVDSPLIGVGTNTTDDPAPLNFNDDIAGDTR